MALKFTKKLNDSLLSDIWEAITLENNVVVMKIPFSKEYAMKEYQLLKEVQDIKGCLKLLCVKSITYQKKDLIAFLFPKLLTDSRRLKDETIFFSNLNNFKKFSFELLSIIGNFHKKLIHCDIRPSNVLVDSNYRPILSDFGNSIFKKDEKLILNGVRTIEQYRDPARIVDTKTKFDEMNDVYSLGCVLYYYYMGMELFSTIKDRKDLIQARKWSEGRIILKTNTSQIGKGVILDLQDLINKMTTFRKSNRINIDNCLKHKFFSKKKM